MAIFQLDQSNVSRIFNNFKVYYDFDFRWFMNRTDYNYDLVIKVAKNDFSYSFILSQNLIEQSYNYYELIYQILCKILHLYGCYMSGQVIYSKLNSMIYNVRKKYGDHQDYVIYMDKTSLDELGVFVDTRYSIMESPLDKQQYFGCDIILVDGPKSHLNVAAKYTYEA